MREPHECSHSSERVSGSDAIGLGPVPAYSLPEGDPPDPEPAALECEAVQQEDFFATTVAPVNDERRDAYAATHLGNLSKADR